MGLPLFSAFSILLLCVCQGKGINPEETSIQGLFRHYASGDNLSRQALKHLLNDLGFPNRLPSQESINNLSKKRVRRVLSEKECLTTDELLKLYKFDRRKFIRYDNYLSIVPTILKQTHNPSCQQPELAFSSSNKVTVAESDHEEKEEKSKSISPWVWISATISIIIISMVGLLGVAVVPLVQKSYYNQVLQFLVALAVGALTGDAMLHLLPHAIVESVLEEHEEGEEGEEGHSHGAQEREAVFKGLTALGGVFFFFIAEKIVGLVSEHRAEKKAEKEEIERAMKSSRKPSTFTDFLSQQERPVSGDHEPPQQQTYTRRLSTALMDDSTLTTGLGSRALKSIDTLYRFAGAEDSEPRGSTSSQPPKSPGLLSVDGPIIEQIGEKQDEEQDAVVLLVPSVEKPSTSNATENKKKDDKEEKKGHGHGHSHDEVPDSVASVAWMVIMGDGLHNFTDGLAIGAAFAKNITGGLSTSIAVFCHELPHELGDFAVLLKTGMPVKQALFYNIVSSVLSLFGVYIGVALGNIESTSIWIFAMTAGIFIYIALVDMMPELNNADVQPGESRLAHFAYQCGGIATGVTIMLLIAIYEDDIKNAFTVAPVKPNSTVVDSDHTMRFFV